jgi:hypothetical protein
MSDGVNGNLPRGPQAAEHVPDGQQPLSAQVLGDSGHSGLDATQITEPWTGAGGRGARQVTDAIRYACARFLWLK